MLGNTGMGTALFLIATGAILAFAIDYEASGIDIQAAGAILIVIGLLAFLLSWLFLSSFSPVDRTRTTYVDRHVHDPAPPAPSHTQVNVNPAPRQPEERTEVNVNQPPAEPRH
jgi:hypothetical protein